MISANEISDQPRFSGLPTDIPALEELKRIPQWVAWKYEHRGGPKPTKPPINPHNGGYAVATVRQPGERTSRPNGGPERMALQALVSSFPKTTILPVLISISATRALESL